MKKMVFHIIHSLKTLLVWLRRKKLQVRMVQYLFVRNALHITLSMNYYKNILNIVQIMKQFL